SQLVNCIIEGSNARGLTLVNSVPVIRQSIIRNNTSPDDGAGLHVTLSPGLTLTLVDTEGSGNTANADNATTDRLRGGILIDGSVVLSRSVITNNTVRAGSVANFSGATGSGGGVYVASGNVNILNSVISGSLVRTESSSPTLPALITPVSIGGGLYVASGT